MKLFYSLCDHWFYKSSKIHLPLSNPNWSAILFQRIQGFLKIFRNPNIVTSIFIFVKGGYCWKCDKKDCKRVCIHHMRWLCKYFACVCCPPVLWCLRQFSYGYSSPSSRVSCSILAWEHTPKNHTTWKLRWSANNQKMRKPVTFTSQYTVFLDKIPIIGILLNKYMTSCEISSNIMTSQNENVVRIFILMGY